MSTASNFPKNIYASSSAQHETTVMICAFEGWNDAGASATDTLSFVERAFNAQKLPFFDTEDFYDLTQMRPLLVSEDDGSGSLHWPHIEVSTHRIPSQNIRLIMVTGPEPTFRWKQFAEQLYSFAIEQEVKHLILLGALLAEVPHTRPFPVSTTSYTDSLREYEGISAQTYTGPTGITGILAYYAQDVGLTDLSAWVSVPHYAGHPPHPKATYSLLLFLESVLDVSIPLQPIEEEVRAWERGAEELLNEEPELAEYVSQLEAETDQNSLDSISGEDIAAELERFLKRRNT